ncbi:hypothetical protein BD410DRAFT_846303 [Rickenella mellea]|uniref:Uncharacterized protein n=1 Tax=Rickenella mellea TaxID=50990 RepID=A0A4Y7PH41_9AGAM|nr:hypothetical protein BD410DRAFT_846303 [Rickenella mellea]
MIDPVVQLIAIAQDIRTSKILSLAATVVLAYDTILTIPEPDETRGDYGYIILALRTLAIWDRDWRATIILGIGAATFNISVLISASLLEKLEWLPYVAQPVSRFETLLHCYIGVTGPPAAITKLGFASLMFYDSVVFILILIRTVHEGCKTRARILTILLRDGMIYYAVLFALSVGNLIIATSLPQFKIALIASLAPALIAAGSIGASHIILNLRKHSYARHTLGLGQLSTMQYAERHMILDDTDVAVIERDQ